MSATSPLPVSTQGLAATAPDPAVVQVFGKSPFHTDGDLLVLAFAGEGTLWSVEEPGVLRHWDMVRGEQLGWQPLSDGAMLWEFSPDAHLLASATDATTLWDVVSGRRLTRLPSATWVTAMTFRRDGAVLATGHDDGQVILWDLASRQELARLSGHRRPISALAFSADGNCLASAGEDKVICLWELPSGQLRGTLLGHTDRVPALAWHPDGDRLYSAGWDTTARVWDTATGEPIILLNSHAGQVTALALNPAGTLLACADSDAAVHLWALATNRTVEVFRGHEAEVRSLAFSPDGQRLVSGGGDRVVRTWSGFQLPATGAPHPALVRRGAELPSEPLEGRGTLATSPDGRRLLSTLGGTALHVWDTSSARPLVQLEAASTLEAITCSPDGRWIAGSAEAIPLRIWDASTGRLQHTLDGQTSPIHALAFAPDSALLASGCSLGSDVWLWNVANGEPALLIPDAVDGCSIDTVAFHPRNPWLAAGGVDWLATGGSDGASAIWDLDRRVEIITLDGGVTALAFHPGGELLATATLSQSIRIWRVADWQDGGVRHLPAFELIGHDDAVTCVVFSPDGRWLVSGSADRTVRIWDADRSSHKITLQFDTQIKALCFSPDGRYLFTGNGNTSCYQLEMARVLR
jgi:WD40 repeat protein